MDILASNAQYIWRSESLRRSKLDPYAGRKLYSYLYDLGFQDIKVNLYSHHLIFGHPADTGYSTGRRRSRWYRKINFSSRSIGRYDEFWEEFYAYFKTREVIYTPLIIARGRKPL
jgi:hypothetical protein